MIVEAVIDGERMHLAYHYEGELKVGDRVVLPEPWWWPDKLITPCHGTIVQIGSDYTGHCRSVIGLVNS